MPRTRQTTNPVSRKTSRRRGRPSRLTTKRPSAKQPTVAAKWGSVSAVRSASTVRLAATACQTSQSNGGSQSQTRRAKAGKGALRLTPKTIAAARLRRSTRPCPHPAGQETVSGSASRTPGGTPTWWSRITGFPNFRSASPSSAPRATHKMPTAVRGFGGAAEALVEIGPAAVRAFTT